MSDDRQTDDVYVDALDNVEVLLKSLNQSRLIDTSDSTNVLVDSTDRGFLDVSDLDSSTSFLQNNYPAADTSGQADVEDEISDSEVSEDDGEENEDADKKSNDETAGHDLNNAETTPDGEFVEPDEKTALAIASQADELFSDESIKKDSYLVKHIRRNKNGFVSLKVVNSLRKIKRLTRDYRAIAYAIKKHSALLELNDAETKVRRRDALINPLPPRPLPSAQETKQVSHEYRSVLVMNLPSDKPPTISSVAELFANCGPIVQIRIIQSLASVTGAFGKLLLKQVTADDNNCAVIEFEKLSDAKKACKKMTDLKDWRHGMRVTLLATMPRKDDKKSGVQGEGYEGSDQDCLQKKPPKKTKKSGGGRTRVNELSHEGGLSSGSLYSSSGSDTEGQRVRNHWRSRGDSPAASPAAATGPEAVRRRDGVSPSPLVNPRTQVLQQDSDSEDWRVRSTRSGSFDSRDGQGRMQSPWALRRLKAQQNAVGGSVGNLSATGEPSSASTGVSRGSLPCLLDAGRVVRQPRGPDGTMGFPPRRKNPA